MLLINNVNELNEQIGIYSITPPSRPEPGDGEEELSIECWAKIRTQKITDIEKNYGTDFSRCDSSGHKVVTRP
ncbi:hypothetical protein [uncultured Vagococcus sp.]|uniref:hypothetical protein n=1 Tax=uncultured Vagococcus sp. TaxID=189676 RepID=UPI00258AA11D|nr:hypothetical protein [uncultured Vagococcus sp.]